MRRPLVAAAVFAIPAVASAATASLPAEPWPKAVACSAHLFVASENLKSAEAGKFGPRTGWTLNTMLGAWYHAAQAMPDYSAERFSGEMGAYIQGPLGAGPEALDNDTRAANLDICVADAVKAEFEARKD